MRRRELAMAAVVLVTAGCGSSVEARSEAASSTSSASTGGSGGGDPCAGVDAWIDVKSSVINAHLPYGPGYFPTYSTVAVGYNQSLGPDISFVLAFHAFETGVAQGPSVGILGSNFAYYEADGTMTWTGPVSFDIAVMSEPGGLIEGTFSGQIALGDVSMMVDGVVHVCRADDVIIG